MKTRRLYVYFLALLTMLLMTVTVNAATVKLNKNKITVPVATKQTLKVTGTKAKVKWSSSNKKVATVTSKGVVKGIKKGNCKVTATVGKKKYTCSVKVVQQTLKLNASSKTIGKGSTFALKATIKNAKSKAVVWKSSDKKIATVSSKGVVKGIKSGNATITATLKENKKVSKKFKVMVKTYVTEIVPAFDWKNGTYYINNPNEILYEGSEPFRGMEAAQKRITVVPADADNKEITFSSSNPKVATVSNKTETIDIGNGRSSVRAPGYVLPIGKGTAVITAKAADGGGATYSWTVNVVDMNDYIKTVSVTKENFPQLFGWTSFVETYTYTNTWGETSTSSHNMFYLTNKQYADGWYCVGPVHETQDDFGVELAVTVQFKDPEGNIATQTNKTTWSGYSFALADLPLEYKEASITKIEVLRVKEGSKVLYLNSKALKSTSAVKTDNQGQKYVEKTCINGYVYRDYEGHSFGGHCSTGYLRRSGQISFIAN